MILALIPAKLTSERLPRKNLKSFAGRPLLHYSLEIACRCGSIDRVYVSSESPEVLDYVSSTETGAEVLLRPAELSLPHITNKDVILHAVEAFVEKEGEYPEYVVLLQPTHPLRRLEDLERSIDQMISDGADHLVTVYKDESRRGKVIDGEFVPLPKVSKRSNQPEDDYIISGSIYIYKTATTLLKGRMDGEKTSAFILKDAFLEVDIDHDHDFFIAEQLYLRYFQNAE